MRLIFDLQALQNGSRSRGIGRYVLHLFRALACEEGIEMFGMLNSALDAHFDEAREIIEEALGPDRLLVFHSLSPTREIDDENESRRLFSEAAYEQFLASLDFDALLVGSLFEGFSDDTVVSLHGTGYLKFVVLYDLIPLLNPAQFLGWDKIHRWYHARLANLAKADGLLAISESARSEAIEHLCRPVNEVFAIGTATDRQIFNEKLQPDAAVPRRFGINRKFVMHASAFEERKNFEGLMRAFAKLPEKIRRAHQLVLAGKASDDARSRLAELAQSLGLGGQQVVFTGYVSDSELAQLYRQCSLFVFPSFHEGFGLPALEAMSCGCPTIGSDRSSIPEVVGAGDLLFDPSSDDEMSDLMAKLLSSDAESERAARHALARARNFSWDTVAANAVAALGAFSPRTRLPVLSLERAVRQICRHNEKVSISASDQQRLAEAISLNERQAIAQVGRTAAETARKWRVEGPFDSSYSLALLNRETARALDRLGYDVSLHSTEGPGDFDPNPFVLQENPDLAAFHARSRRGTRKPDVVSRLLYPPRVKDMGGNVNALHHYAWEESGFPQEWVEEFNSRLTMMTCLSRHVEKIMVDNGVTVPLTVSGCGVDHWERVAADPALAVRGRAFRFLHVSSCFARKGVDSLLRAYGLAFTSEDDVTLIIKTFENPHNEVADQLEKLRRENPGFPDVELIFADLSDSELKALYEGCHVMVGPSCAEGFGLPFAEAMLSGLPVITTKWGGQLDFCNDGNSWLVDYEFERAASHFALSSSVWARVSEDSLAAAMRQARDTPVAERRAMAQRGCQQLLDSHKWSDVALRLSAASAVLPRREPREPKIGWVTTWGSKCGIATYSAHLTRQLGLSTTVFAPVNEIHGVNQPNVIRCWSLGKQTGDYADVIRECRERGLRVLIIQFNYNFYDHVGLSRLIDECRSEDMAVVLFLHSTVDPPEPRDELYHLRHIRPALFRCDRILVHSVADLNRLKDLGLTDNVTLFPHGILDVKPRPAKLSATSETLVSYGFALPHKGLEQLVEATALLHRRGRPVRLRLVNSEYPVDVSRRVIEDLHRRIGEHGLSDYVECYHDFLPDDESLRLIQECALAVFPYQETGESASGAVRYGMAAGVPVAVTPIGIFDDLGNAAFRFEGTDAQSIADGVESILDAIQNSQPDATATLEAADRWRSQHRYSSVSRRLRNLCVALANQPVLGNRPDSGGADQPAVLTLQSPEHE